MRKDILAAGAHKATFKAGDASIDDAIQVNPGMVSNEARNEFVPVEIDRTRKVRRIVPKGDNILVQRSESEDVSAGGILIPEDVQNQDRPAEGVILAVGPKVNKPTASLRTAAESEAYRDGLLKVGDHIIFGRYAGTEYPFGGETLLFMREDEVIATVEE